MVTTLQRGNQIHWHPHVHAIASDGVFDKDGHFVNISEVDLARCVVLWRKKVFDLLLREKKVTQEVIQWAHSGFSVDNSVRQSWAALIKSVHKVDPLECPNCGGRIPPSGISFIEKCQPVVIEKILRHCGMWKETVQRPPPGREFAVIKEPSLDYEFFDRICI